MLTSLNLLKKYVELPVSATPEEIVAKLSACTVEVEDFFESGKDLENIVVGKVVKLEKHPNADKLKIVKADLGQEYKKTRIQEKKEEGSSNLVKIVCGGVNLYEGMLTAVALPGAMVKWHGEGESVKLEKTKIRGEESEGMICAANEIGLADRFPADELEILDLTALDFKVGEPLAKELGLDDVIIDIDNKSITNRPDLWSHYGIAREVAAIYNLELKPLLIDEKLALKESKAKGNKEFKINIKEYDFCPRYLGVVVENIKVKESPLWLKNFLNSIGLRPINNIVDITNYVMAEVGQPMHAFDRSKVDNIVVRTANQGEKIVTLDKAERVLAPETLVIADSKKPIAIAGVMGGYNSQISNETKTIILESANFEAVSIRKTAQKLGLRTEASMRFEKALDYKLAEAAMRRACKLISEIIPEAKFSGIITTDGSDEKEALEIEAGIKKIQARIGAEIKKEEMLDILGRLGFEAKEKKENLLIRVPSWRSTGDVSIAEDIIEEIARIYGYDKIKSEFPEIKMQQQAKENERLIFNKLKDILSLGAGMQETLNYSFWAKKLVDDWGLAKELELIGLQNPMSEEQTYLRMSLAPGLLKNVGDNSRFYEEFKLYETGRVFFDRKGKYRVEKNSKEHLPEQPYYLSGAVVTTGGKEPFLLLKGIVEKLSEELELDFAAWSAGRNNYHELINKMVNREKRLAIVSGKEKIGWIGEINMATIDYFGIKKRRVAVFELDLTTILETKKKETKQYRSAPKYPVVERDIAIEIAWKARWENIKKEIEKINPLIREIIFLSEYDLGKKKSLAFRIKYQAPDRTLKDEEIETVEKEIVRFLGEKFGATRR